VVSDGTGIPIDALSLPKNLVLATRLPLAGIHGAIVAIIADVDIVALHQDRLVCLAIAIIVKTVAGLLCRLECVTGGESFFHTHAFALAGAGLVDGIAWRPERQVHRLAGAGTHPCIRHALTGFDAIDRHCVRTGESPRAVSICQALASAEAPLVPIVQAEIIHVAYALAVRGF